MKILVVDDDQVSLNMLQEFLEKNHFEVYLAQNAEQAMQEVRANQIPLVLSDIKMEESDGLGGYRHRGQCHTGHRRHGPRRGHRHFH